VNAKTLVTYLLVTTAVLGGLGPTAANLAGVLPPRWLEVVGHVVATAAALHLWLVQSPLIQPLLATKTASEIAPQISKARDENV
jgi:hypothetical protein